MLVHFLRSSALLARMHLVELLSSKRLIFAALLAALPPLLALLVANVAPERARFGPGMIHAQASLLLLLQVVVPLGSLLVASGLIADEVEGRTITYLFTRATPRAAVLLGRVAAVIGLLVPLFALSAWATALAAAQRPGTTYPEAVQSVILAAAAGALVYSLIGAVLGVLFKRALVVALAYAFAIEGFIANVPGSTARLAVQYWLRSLAIDLEVEPWSKMRALRSMVAPVEHDVAAVRLALIAFAVLLFGVLMVRRRQYVLTS